MPDQRALRSFGLQKPNAVWHDEADSARRGGPREMGRSSGAVVGRSIQLRVATWPPRVDHHSPLWLSYPTFQCES